MEDLSLHILDVAENGIGAGARLIRITLDEDLLGDKLSIIIDDNGRGMEPGLLAKVLDPFVTTRTTRKVGLGLSLFQQSAQQAEGDLRIESVPGVGTHVQVDMRHSHIDRKPLGNLVDTMLALIEGNPDIDFVYTHKKDEREYLLDTREIRSELEDIPMNHPAVVGLIRVNLLDGLKELD